MTGHKIDFEKTVTTSTREHFPTRIIREAIKIGNRSNNFNKRDDAQRLSPAWTTVLKYIPTDWLQEVTQDRQNTDNDARPSCTAGTPAYRRPTKRRALVHLRPLGERERSEKDE
ncbi:hypothetical protein Trydic_g6668 [Trypoxylus dichotomus]